MSKQTSPLKKDNNTLRGRNLTCTSINYKEGCLHDVTEDFYSIIYNRLSKVDLVNKVATMYELCTKIPMTDKQRNNLYRKSKDRIIFDLITYFKGWL